MKASRRRLLAGLAAWPAAARAAPPGLAFRVLRDGQQIGTHRVAFREAGGRLQVASEIRLRLRLAGFTVFRFEQDCAETWQGERLLALDCRSERNGRPGGCAARAEPGGLRLAGAAGETLLPATAVPLTWWRAASLLGGAPLFDVREGRPLAPRIERLAEGPHLRIRVTGETTGEALYDAAGTWIGFATAGEDGSAVRYEPA